MRSALGPGTNAAGGTTIWPLTYVKAAGLPLASRDVTCSRLVSKSSTSGREASFNVNRMVVAPVSGEASAEGIDSDRS